MSKKWKRQAMGVVLSAAMAVTALPVTALPVMAKEPEELLHFTFDNLTNGFQSNGYKAKIVGNKYDINDDSSYGKVLNLGGKTYLNVADENGNSPLNGLDELTVNYYSKPAAGGHNGWTFFATRDDETPHYLSSEHYIGIMDKADSVKAERHLVDNSSRPAALETKTESGWKMVTVVYEADKSTLYINGEKVSEEKSDAKLTDILQDNSTLKIGKSNWGEEYFAGELDDYSIYAGALSEEEIAELYENKSNETVLSTNEKIHKVADSLEISNADCIKGNITLPTENEYGAKITWKSSDPDVINDKDAESENYGKIPAGVVHRGKEDKKVTLTATISLDGEEENKQFEVNVVKKADKKQLDKYLFTFFPSNDDENLYFSAGSDHLHFKDLNDGKPVLTSSIGDEGIRDPFIFRSAEGDHFYIIATDLKVNETGWGNAQYNGSLKMLVWESDDLVNWSEPRLVDVGLTDKDFENYGKVSCLWAPEAIYDEKTGEYVVFWASMTTEDGVSHQITYYSKTRDFVNFTTAEKYIDRGDKQHCIDTSIVEANGKYYRVSADTNANGGSKSEIIIETSDSVLGEWTRLCNMDDLSGGMQNYDKFKDFYRCNTFRLRNGWQYKL